jgi:putative flippase GtrA
MRHALSQLMRYAVVGAVATLVHYLLLVACVELAGWPAWLASGFGAVAGAQIAYYGNRRFTFAHGGARAASWPRFQATALLGAVAGMGVVALAVRAGLYVAADLRNQPALDIPVMDSPASCGLPGSEGRVSAVTPGPGPAARPVPAARWRQPDPSEMRRFPNTLVHARALRQSHRGGRRR